MIYYCFKGGYHLSFLLIQRRKQDYKIPVALIKVEACFLFCQSLSRTFI